MSNILKFKGNRIWQKSMFVQLSVVGLIGVIVGLGYAYFPGFKVFTDTPPEKTEMITGSVRVIDGDTIRLGREKIRLFGIDAPEANQKCTNRNGADYSCGIKSTTQLKSLIGPRAVHCDGQNRDNYNRLLAVCYAGDLNLNAAMVSTGWAIAYTYFSNAYVLQQASAKLNGLGIWQGSFQEPYLFRQSH